MKEFDYEICYESLKSYVIGCFSGAEEIEAKYGLSDYGEGMKAALKMILKHINVTEEIFK